MFEGIYFANPDYLWLLLVLPLLVGWYVFSRKKTQAVLKISSLNGFRAKHSFLAQLQPALFILRIFSLTLIVMALARPQTMDVSTRTKTNKGIDIVMAIDISSSMLAQDLKPNRLTALKRVAASFVDDWSDS